MQRSLRTLASFLAILLTIAPSYAEDWPCWRGPRGDGTSEEMRVPTQWSSQKNIVWKVEIPGLGHSSPIIHGDRIFVTTCDTDSGDRLLFCLDRRTGEKLWQQVVLNAPLEGKHRLNSYSSSTPATDGKLVYVSFLDRKDMFIAAYDFEGKLKWAVKPGVFSSVHGYCASPLLYKDMVIVNGDHDGPAYLVALDRETGKTKWKVERENRTRSYCTPIIREIDGRTQMILSGSKCVASYNPEDGSRYWIIDGPTQQFVASMVYNGEYLFLTAGFPTEHVMAIRPDGKGNVTDSHVVWHHQAKEAAYVPSPIVMGQFYIVADDFGTVTCYDARTGKTHWSEKLGRHYSASIVSANGLIYITADEGLERGAKGVTHVIRPGVNLDVVSVNTLDEAVYSSPAISQGQIFMRAEKHLYCIGGNSTN